MSAIVRQLEQKISVEGAHFDAIDAELDLIARQCAEIKKAIAELPDAVAKAVVEELARQDRQGR